MTEENKIDVTDALNEYFTLKKKFEDGLMVNKKKIINNPNLSKREKRTEFLRLMPKCVNCNRPSKKGTIFSVTYHEADIVSYRTFKAICGNIVDPCNLDIDIDIGNVNSIEELIDESNQFIKKNKNNIINDKNKLLFGLITTETALENFNNYKENIEMNTSMYESYLEIWNNQFDNPAKKLQLDEAIVESYNYIKQIKDSIKKMNVNDNLQYVTEAVNIYHTLLQPLFIKIRNLKYSQNFVYLDDNDYCRLIQNKYSIDDNSLSLFDNKVKTFNIGLKVKSDKKDKTYKKNKNKKLIIESDEEELQDSRTLETNQIPQDEPIIGQGKDGIEWNIIEYQNLWSKLPETLKNEFKLNIDWMKDFMHKCVNSRSCKLTTPPNLIIPPKFNQSNETYDFGVPIYNKAFNKLDIQSKETYLSLYKIDSVSKSKDYNQLENAINDLVEREVNFDKINI